MKAYVYKEEAPRRKGGASEVWHVDCHECVLAGGVPCLGWYSKHEAAIANADAHMRAGIHGPQPTEEW